MRHLWLWLVVLCLASNACAQSPLRRSKDDLRDNRYGVATLAGVPGGAFYIQGFVHDEDEVVRYWAALGLANAGGYAKTLEPLLRDKSPSVRGVAAYGIAKAGHTEEGIAVLLELLDHHQPAVVTEAMTWLDRLGAAAQPHAPKIAAVAESGMEYPQRLAKRMLARWQTR